MNSFSSPVEIMNRELREADPELVGNADVLRGVLSGCGDCIKILDLDGRLQFMSEGGKRVMEVDDFASLKGCPWPDFWAGESNQFAAEAVKAARSGETFRFRGPANTAKGTPRYWDVSVSPIFGSDGRPSQLLSISKDITEQWLADKRHAENVERERFLKDELEHRVKNAFSLVISIATQTFRGASFFEPLKKFSTRIVALSGAYEGLNKNRVHHAPVESVIKTAIGPYEAMPGRFILSDEIGVMLTPQQATSLTLALNELATNAAKYGALSVSGGEVKIAWRKSIDGPDFILSWEESGGPLVVQPTRRGFGSRIVQDILPRDLGGEVELSYPKTGLVCRITVPIANLIVPEV